MNTIQIQYFIAVAECLNFTKAAQISFTSQPNISKQVALLEEELGFALFFRTKQSVVLTHAGQMMYDEFKELLSSLNNAVAKAAQASKNTQYNLKIGVSTFLDTENINKAIRDFQEKFPLSDILIESVNYETLRSKIAHENYDIAISAEFAFANVQDIETTVIAEHKLMLVVSSAHANAWKKDVNVGDFKDELFFVLEDTPKGTDMVIEICREYGFTPKMEVCNSLASYFVNLELGNGVAIVDTSLRLPEKSFETLSFIEILDKISTVKQVAAFHNKNTNPAIPLFLDEFKEGEFET